MDADGSSFEDVMKDLLSKQNASDLVIKQFAKSMKQSQLANTMVTNNLI